MDDSRYVKLKEFLEAVASTPDAYLLKSEDRTYGEVTNFLRGMHVFELFEEKPIVDAYYQHFSRSDNAAGKDWATIWTGAWEETQQKTERQDDTVRKLISIEIEALRTLSGKHTDKLAESLGYVRERPFLYVVAAPESAYLRPMNFMTGYQFFVSVCLLSSEEGTTHFNIYKQILAEFQWDSTQKSPWGDMLSTGFDEEQIMKKIVEIYLEAHERLWMEP